MRWRYIKAALIGGLLGFAGQFFGDNLFLHPNGHPDGSKTYAWVSGGSSQFNYIRRGGVDEYIESHYRPELSPQEHILFYKILLLLWLKDRGALAFNAVAIGALLGAASVLAVGQLHKSRNACKPAQRLIG